jgi:phage major tail protein, phi13 family|nr:MAG TPA: tail tube protein [Caudoviricetes sp.]
MAEEKNIVEFGVENLHLATLKNDGEFDTPVNIKGTSKIKLSGKGDSKIIYADNGTFYVISSNTGYEGELEIYNFDDDFKIKYLGFKRDGNGILLEPSILKPVSLAMAFKILGDVKDRVSVLYNCIFEKPDIELKTVEEKIDVEVMKIKFKARPKEFQDYDEKIVQASTLNEKAKETWFTKIYTPSKTKTLQG